MSKIVLYGHPLSPFVRMVHAVAEIVKSDYEFKVLDIENKEHKQEWYLKINPQGKIPAITDGDFKLTESHAIMKYLCYKQGETSLYPSDAITRAKIDEALCRVTDSKFCWFVFVSQAFFNGGPTNQEKINEFEKGLLDFLSFHPDTAETGYLIGNQLTLADIALAHRLSIPSLAGYKFEKFPEVKSMLEQIWSKKSGSIKSIQL